MKYRPHLPNRGSKHQTLASLRVDLHYARLGITVRWDWDRYRRLAAFLNLTPFELASIVCMSHTACESCERRNKFPGPVAMLLTLLESQALKEFTADVIPNPFPHDSAQGSKT